MTAEFGLPPADIGGPIHAIRTQSDSHCSQPVYMIWSVEDCRKLREVCQLAVSSVGLCSAKLATKGKAAAVPVVLSDEELYTLYLQNWIVAEDSVSGEIANIKHDLEEMGKASNHVLRRRAVFYDLWKRGYRCTNGLKFGVDYLTYKADPSVVHAAYMVIVAPEGIGMAPLDLVTRARVATTALKICVIAYVNVDSLNTTGRAGGEPIVCCGATGHAGSEPIIRYAAFKRIGPGSATFESSSATLDAVKATAALVTHTTVASAAAAIEAAAEGAQTASMEYVDPATLFGPA